MLGQNLRLLFRLSLVNRAWPRNGTYSKNQVDVC